MPLAETKNDTTSLGASIAVMKEALALMSSFTRRLDGDVMYSTVQTESVECLSERKPSRVLDVRNRWSPKSTCAATLTT